jgi:hypothetical protein
MVDKNKYFVEVENKHKTKIFYERHLTALEVI